MANQFTIYKSTDASAPVLNAGSAGSIIALLDACLVNGYGSKAAAGWSKAFSGTNKAVYRAPSGIRHYFRIDNSGAAQTNPVTGYESMSDVDTGTHQYFAGYLLNGLINPATWVLAADAVTFILLIDATGGTYYGIYWGEFYSFVSNDSYRGILRAGTNTTVSSGNETLDVLATSVATPTAGAYIDRGHTGVGAAVQASITGDSNKSGGSTTLNGSSLPFPNPADGGAYISPVWISDPTTAPANGLRGRLRGFWQWLHPIAGVSNGDTISGTGDLSGRSFLIVKQSAHSGIYLIETSATLETN